MYEETALHCVLHFTLPYTFFSWPAAFQAAIRVTIFFSSHSIAEHFSNQSTHGIPKYSGNLNEKPISPSFKWMGFWYHYCRLVGEIKPTCKLLLLHWDKLTDCAFPVLSAQPSSSPSKEMGSGEIMYSNEQYLDTLCYKAPPPPTLSPTNSPTHSPTLGPSVSIFCLIIFSPSTCLRLTGVW